tara:strand:- start:848 stop:1063 length:216 start_codon:yes stop_codon:yes gene_type:complete
MNIFGFEEVDAAELIAPAAAIFDELAGPKGDQIASSVAKFTRKIHQAFIREGYREEQAVFLTEAWIKKANG